MKRRTMKKRGGFTLIELLVVISIIVIMAVLVVPSFSSIVKSVAWPLAYNTMSTMISISRMEAIARQQYSGVHVQLADTANNPELDGLQFAAIVTGKTDQGYFTSYSGSVLKDYGKSWSKNDDGTTQSPWLGYVVILPAGTGMNVESATTGIDVPFGTVDYYTPADAVGAYKNTLRLNVTGTGTPLQWKSLYQILPTFQTASGFTPSKLPRPMCFGHLDNYTTAGAKADFIDSSGNYSGAVTEFDDAGVKDFTTFTVVFAPTGRLVTKPLGRNVFMNQKAVAFAGNTTTSMPRLWQYSLTNDNGSDGSTTPDGEPAVSVITLFQNDPAYFGRIDKTKRATWLDTQAMFLPINQFTGEFMDKR